MTAFNVILRLEAGKARSTGVVKDIGGSPSFVGVCLDTEAGVLMLDCASPELLREIAAAFESAASALAAHRGKR